MKHVLLATFCLLFPIAMLAQAPMLTGLTPLANATAVPCTTSLTATFSQPLAPSSASALRVFSAQRGGLRTRRTPATVSGNTLAFAPSAYPSLPGETVQYTITTAAAGSSGAAARPRVGQFTTAVGTANTGVFAKTAATPPPVPAQYYASSVALNSSFYCLPPGAGGELSPVGGGVERPRLYGPARGSLQSEASATPL